MPALNLFFFVLVGAWMAHSVGNAQALQQREFLVPSTKSNSVVVRAYGDRFICAEYDIVTKKLTRKLFFLTPSSDKGLEFELKTIGPLNLR